MKRDCHFVVVEIEKLCRRFEIRLETLWVLRESRQIEYCDVWSKEVVELDYCMSKVCSRDLWDKFGLFYADYFASDQMYRMKVFFARFASGESEGADVFGVFMEGRFRIIPSSRGSDIKSSQESGEREGQGSAGGSGLAREQLVGSSGREGLVQEVDFGGQCVFGVGVSNRDCVKHIQRGA